VVRQRCGKRDKLELYELRHACATLLMERGLPAHVVANQLGNTDGGALVQRLYGVARGIIPNWYHSGMSKQIAVRLPDDLVEFVDDVVGSGRERSRAAVVSRALERERRRAIAERDAAILAATGPDAELAGLAGYAAGLDPNA
jgi:Arc/MetJ-type ribon-helix-helix transcriptional regulator